MRLVLRLAVIARYVYILGEICLTVNNFIKYF
nr:MAG TPA: hypothetical protein [Caudoviricetes sp.]